MSSAQKRTASATYARKPTRRPLASESESSSASDMPVASEKSPLKKSSPQKDKANKENIVDDDKESDESALKDGTDPDEDVVFVKNSKVKKVKKVKKDDADDEDEGEKEEESEEEEDYEVSEIKSHKFVKGVYNYRVGWKTYPSDDDTWEPEENLTGAKELLTEYKKIHGIDKPRSARQSLASAKSSGRKSKSRDDDSEDDNGYRSDTKKASGSKRKRVEEKEPTGIARLKRNGYDVLKSKSMDRALNKGTREAKKARELSVSSGDESVDASEWHAQHRDQPSWEHLVKGIRTIERVDNDDSGKGRSSGGSGVADLNVCLLWNKDGKTTWVPNSVAREKLPQKMLDFYENHLQFAANAQ